MRQDQQATDQIVTKLRSAPKTTNSLKNLTKSTLVVRKPTKTQATPRHHIFTGRRKTSVARVWLVPRASGDYSIKINGRTLEDYMPREADQRRVLKPLIIANKLGNFDVVCTAKGGGPSGQSGAIQLGVARALLGAEADLKAILRNHSLLTRDPRMVERKKPGQHGARKKTQFSKR